MTNTSASGVGTYHFFESKINDEKTCCFVAEFIAFTKDGALHLMTVQYRFFGP